IRPDIDMTVAPVRNPTFVTLSDGSIRNTYDVRLRNKHGEERPFRMSLTGNPALRIQIEGTPYETVTVPADTAKLVRVYVVAPADSAPAEDERTEFRFWVEDITNGDRAHAASIFNGRSN
ncbi:MAG: FixG Ig-like domain-containing protein, partial [Pseudomonadota bacterium]|nr:FixG Ig-like domain-containing protein [Pseudomonadota bacterium]